MRRKNLWDQGIARNDVACGFLVAQGDHGPAPRGHAGCAPGTQGLARHFSSRFARQPLSSKVAPMKLLLHIGAAKAGSTTIQAALGANRDHLLRHDVLFWEPSRAKVPPPRVLSNLFEPDHKPLLPRERLHFKSRAEAHAWSQENWARMAHEVTAHKPALTILSSESMYYFRPGRILDALRKVFSEIVLLMYVRDPVQLYRSTLDQLIRDGARMAALPLPQGVSLNAANRLRTYIAALGQDNVILRRFDRQCFVGGDLITDLFAQISQALGQPVPVGSPVDSVNESFCAAATLWILSLNEGFERFSAGNDADQVRMRQDLLQRIRTAPELKGLKKLADPQGEIADWVRLGNREDIAFLNRRAFNATLPLTQARGTSDLPDEATQRASLRAWLLAQAEPAELARVLAAAIA